jgi:hypothetical protein
MTVPGIGPGSWDAGKLAESQELHARALASSVVTYRIYTEDRLNLVELVSRYFDGATLYYTRGLWRGEVESGAVIEILGTPADLQKIMFLAGDIKHTNAQQSVLVSWSEGKWVNL